MNRLEFIWKGHYYDLIKDGEIIGEVYYSINTKNYCLKITAENHLRLNELKQITDFIESENESNKSYR